MMMHKPKNTPISPQKQRENFCEDIPGQLGQLRWRRLCGAAVMLNLGIEEGLLAAPLKPNAAPEEVAQTRRGSLYLKGLKIQ